MGWITLVSCIAVVAGVLPAFGAKAPEFRKIYPPLNDVLVDHHVAIPMRDGVTLYADVYRPKAGGKFPVLVQRTPYSVQRAPAAYEEAVFYAERGYVMVFEDVRGRFESEGKWEPFRNEGQDGYDTIEWAAKQPWSNGKVAMRGHSYGGQLQWRAALTQPPHLVTIFPLVASSSLYHNWITLNGAWRLAFNFGWGADRMESRIMENTGIRNMKDGPPGQRYDAILPHLPLIDMEEAFGHHAQFYTDWLHHPDYDAYWKPLNAEAQFQELGIPVFVEGGWFDIFTAGTQHGFIGMSQHGKTELARNQAHMVIGPWEHSVSRVTGDIDFGPAAKLEREVFELPWFDHWLKGMNNGVESDPRVTIFVMGKNVWRQENEFPLARTQYRKIFFASSGAANTATGDGKLSWDAAAENSKTDQYDYDPNNPVPSTGGNNCCGVPTSSGPRDQRAIEWRKDILVYTSEPLRDEVEVTGPVKVVVHAASNAPDTDFVAKLIDVYPDGHAYNVCEGILRARYRNGVDKPSLLEPGKPYELTIDLIGTSNVFLKGHRMRVDITSSHFPEFDRNPNTGEPFGMSAKVRTAHQTIYHSAAMPSYIVLPVIPEEGTVSSARR
jgi:putative CocE/NonD family hydrolase